MKSAAFQKYVVRHPVSGIYRYYRKVPIEAASFESRRHIKQSLKTRDLKEALERAQAVHAACETYWRAMLSGAERNDAVKQYEAAVRAAQSLNFTYHPAAVVAEMDSLEFFQRVRAVTIARKKPLSTSALVIDAAFGVAPPPAPRLSEVWELYEKHNQAGLTGMSAGQLDLHKTSRERAIRYCSDVLGDVELSSITREDVLRVRDWWNQKILDEGLTAYTANRSFSDMKGMLGAIDDALRTRYREPWLDIRIKTTNATKGKKRRPFSPDFVQNRILAPGALDGMDEDAKLIVYTMVETGMRPNEICNLRPVDIKLDDPVPHLEVADRTDRRQKSEYSVRQVPLVGVALWAMKQRPNGFPKYQDNANTASATINKALRSRELCPTMSHTLYSLRHTFQDRIENAGASDRMQANLMGHEFGRPVYGDGPELKRRQDFLESIKFRWEEPKTPAPIA
ncbi:DUF6538 domain-containing protein [Shinella zoogloeoides]|uniref:DUF6538 domain-containing protein n=1 Tax=Shinella zoogloeoides TaxID=352475 RepID=UPI00299EE838|nr:DUF6538 domain-containing protein [Shinella zoogloeoides]WPE19985.1 hypothetical protein ShzoTeo12_11650 [Shinella zoogloeoides]